MDRVQDDGAVLAAELRADFGREAEVSCFGAPDQPWAHSEAEQYAGKSKAREKRGRREEDVEEELRSRQVLD